MTSANQATKRILSAQKLINNGHWLLMIAVMAMSAFYWLYWSTDMYTSESNVVLDSPRVAGPELSFGGIFGNAGGAKTTDMLMLRDYLLSVDMMQQVASEVSLVRHYSNSRYDFFSRLRNEKPTQEEMHEYYRKVVQVELDSYAGVLRISVDAFSPRIAHEISKILLSQGEGYINELSRKLAQSQVKFLDEQVGELRKQYQVARRNLVEYQNLNGLVSPSDTVAAIETLVGSLEVKLASSRAERGALLSYQSDTSPAVLRATALIEALDKQIKAERDRLARTEGEALNVTSSEYQALLLAVQFAEESYTGALSALQSTRIDAARQLKQISILQSPTLPQYAVKPNRVYNTVVSLIVILFLGLIAHMIIVIIKDHKD